LSYIEATRRAGLSDVKYNLFEQAMLVILLVTGDADMKITQPNNTYDTDI
jgi:hypothetical protein